MKQLFNIYSTILIIVSVFLFELDVKGVSIMMLIFYGIQLLLFIKVFTKSCKRPIQYMRPFLILLLSCCVVNFQGIIDSCVMDYRTFFQDFYLEKYIDKCLYLSIIAQTALTLGYVNYNPKFSKRIYHIATPNKTLLNILLIVVFLLFIIFIDIRAFMIGDASKVNDGSATRQVGTLALYSEVLLTAIIVICISSISIQLRRSSTKVSIKNYAKSLGISFWIVFSIYMFLRLLSGDRGPVIYNLAILYFGYVYASGFRLSLKGTVIIVVGGAFAVTLIGIARKQSTTLSFIDKVSIANTKFNESEEKSISPLTSELAGSGKIAAIAIQATEDGSIKYGYGKYEVSTVVLKIPFLSRLILTLNPNAKLNELSSSELFTREVLGANYTYGLGTSAVGESYIDFYVYGPILIFFLFGMLYKTVDICITEQKIVNPYLFTIILYLSGYAVYIGRSSFAFVLSGAIMSVIIQYFIHFASINYNRN